MFFVFWYSDFTTEEESTQTEIIISKVINRRPIFLYRCFYILIIFTFQRNILTLFKADLRYGMGSKSSKHEKSDNDDDTDVEQEDRDTMLPGTGLNDDASIPVEYAPSKNELGRYFNVKFID